MRRDLNELCSLRLWLECGFTNLPLQSLPLGTPNQPIMSKATVSHLLCHTMQYVGLITSISQFAVIGKIFRVGLENANRDTSNKIKSV